MSAAEAPATRGGVALRGVVKRHGALTVLHGIDLEIRPGEFFVLLGPSGSGKTTTLRVLAGLEPIHAGQVLLDGEDVSDRDPGERDVAMVFQSYALYPHMTVAQNIGFPLKMIGRPGAEIGQTVAAAASKVSIGHLLDRRPGQLSGGQQQRVALARAIVREPHLFLLDEPLSNLDARLRLEMRVELKKLQRSLGVTAVYVTHDQEEAMTLADRIAIFMEGRIVQVGTPADVFRRPTRASVAGFIGTPPMNLLAGTWDEDAVTVEGGGRIALGARSPRRRAVTLGIRPADLRLAESTPSTDAALIAEVELIEELGDSRIAVLRVGDQRIKLKSTDTLSLTEGQTVALAVDAGAVHLFDRESGERLDCETRTTTSVED